MYPVKEGNLLYKQSALKENRLQKSLLIYLPRVFVIPNGNNCAGNIYTKSQFEWMWTTPIITVAICTQYIAIVVTFWY